jgi:hypothetical protein
MKVFSAISRACALRKCLKKNFHNKNPRVPKQRQSQQYCWVFLTLLHPFFVRQSILTSGIGLFTDATSLKKFG